MSISVKNAGGGGGALKLLNSIIQKYVAKSDTVAPQSFVEFVNSGEFTDYNASNNPSVSSPTTVTYDYQIHAETLGCTTSNGLVAVAIQNGSNAYTLVVNIKYTGIGDTSYTIAVSNLLGVGSVSSSTVKAWVLPQRGTGKYPATSGYYVVHRYNSNINVTSVKIELGTNGVYTLSTFGSKTLDTSKLPTSGDFEVTSTYWAPFVFSWIDTSTRQLKILAVKGTIYSGANNTNTVMTYSDITSVTLPGTNTISKHTSCRRSVFGDEIAFAVATTKELYVLSMYVSWSNSTSKFTLATSSVLAMATFNNAITRIVLKYTDNYSRLLVLVTKAGASSSATNSYNVCVGLLELINYKQLSVAHSFKILDPLHPLFLGTGTSSNNVVHCTECFYGYVVVVTKSQMCVLYLYDNNIKIVSQTETLPNNVSPLSVACLLGRISTYNEVYLKVLLMGSSYIVQNVKCVTAVQPSTTRVNGVTKSKAINSSNADNETLTAVPEVIKW